MNRTAAVTLALLVLVGSVPAAAAVAGGAQTTDTGDGAAPGAVFAGVVGVQGAEVDNEIDRRAFAQQFAAASSNDSKAAVVADQSRQLRERLDELEAKKARLVRAHENGSIGQGEYRARLAELAAQIRAVERQANRTATNAASLPEPALREHGANVSEVRSIARQANRTGGGEVAEAARQIAGEGVGNGLGPPEHAGPPADGGPPEDAGSGNGAGPSGENETGPGTGEEPGAPEDAGPGNGTGNGSNAGNSTGGPPSDGGAESGSNGGNDTGGDGNAPDGTGGDDARDARERDDNNGEDTDDGSTETDSDETDDGGENDAETDGTETVTPTATA
ncbi:hypothetical protein [Halolamina sp. C58]|uniref:hypothetical protein n=1 Tax=Halolamina sp. C58 TaxID=3421640 RepID=UPI003EBDC6AC